MLADAGFAHVQVRELESDPFNHYYYYYYYLVLLLPRPEMTGRSHGRSMGASAAWRARSSSSQSPLQ
jgi:hypothetical protein